MDSNRMTNFDEHSDSDVPDVAKYAADLKARTDIPIMDCYYGNRSKDIFGLIDIWCGQFVNQPWVAERQEAGERFWSVNNSLIWFIEFEPVQGRRELWQDFVDGLDGRLLYSNIRWSRNVYEENWSTGGNYLGCTIYPSPEGLAKSIRLEAIRDGIEDYDYLSLLRSALPTYRDAAGKQQERAAQEAMEILADESLAAGIRSPARMYELRDRIADLIERLTL